MLRGRGIAARAAPTLPAIIRTVHATLIRGPQLSAFRAGAEQRRDCFGWFRPAVADALPTLASETAIQPAIRAASHVRGVRPGRRSHKDDARLPGTAAATVVANFDDPASLAPALEGVTRAYLVTPSSPHAEAQQVRFAEQAAAAGVKHLVKLSQFAADEASPVRFLRYHAAVERRIRELGVGFTFLRPNLYFQGLLAFQSMIATEGHFVAPIGDARVSAVDVRDIAAVATRALTESGHEGKTYTITGPAAVTHVEMASAIAEAIGRPVAFIDVPSDAFAGALKAAGVPTWQVDGLVEDYAHYARGEAETISPHVREVTGADPRDMREFAKDYARAFVGA